MTEFDFLLKVDLFNRSLSEQKSVINDFWKKAGQVLDGTGINLRAIPKKWLSLRHNYFSVLFIVAFFTLGIPLPRLRLYARLNHCLRTWVTACDNLLDNELKELLLTDLPGDAIIFKSVHTILVADRIFFLFLIDAVREGIITESEMERLMQISLASISASGREEAEEERGVDYDLSPEDVLHKIHFAKTGQLFTAPLRAPVALGDADINDKKVQNINEGLCCFALGCQILDDLSDLGMDLMNRKHNYLAAVIMQGEDSQEREKLSGLLTRNSGWDLSDDLYLYQRFPLASARAADEAKSQFHRALDQLCKAGLPLNNSGEQTFLKALMKIFGHPKLLMRLRGQ